jgi:hypothetical protein
VRVRSHVDGAFRADPALGQQAPSAHRIQHHQTPHRGDGVGLLAYHQEQHAQREVKRQPGGHCSQDDLSPRARAEIEQFFLNVTFFDEQERAEALR